MSIRTYFTGLTGAAVPFAELREGAPDGTLLTTLNIPALPGLLTLTPNMPATLLPMTSYWLVVGNTGPANTSFEWSYAEGNNYVGAGVFANYNYSSDMAATWVDFGLDDPYRMEVNVNPAAIPEPSSLVLCVLAVGAILIARRAGLTRGRPSPD